MVVILPRVHSRCRECFAMFSSSLELWGAEGLGTPRLWVPGPGTVWRGRKVPKDVELSLTQSLHSLSALYQLFLPRSPLWVYPSFSQPSTVRVFGKFNSI